MCANATNEEENGICQERLHPNEPSLHPNEPSLHPNEQVYECVQKQFASKSAQVWCEVAG